MSRRQPGAGELPVETPSEREPAGQAAQEGRQAAPLPRAGVVLSGDAVEAPTPPAPASRPPRIRLRLRTVMIVVCLLILSLPLAGVYALRLHETTLMNQAEQQLSTAAAFIAATYGTLLETEVDPIVNPPFLDLDAPIRPPIPPAMDGPPAEAWAQRAGERMVPLLAHGTYIASAEIDILDPQGVVVASSGTNMGRSRAHVGPVRSALGGVAETSLHLEPGMSSYGGVVRGAAIRVLLAMPILADGKVLGVVVLAKSPSTIIDTLLEKRDLLLQGGAVLLLVVAMVGIVTARSLVSPIRRLARSAARVASGATPTFELAKHFRVREIADLASSIEDMVRSLQERASYVRNLARHINHEFKTPIAAAKGAVELLNEQLPTMTEAEARHFVRNVSDDIGRLERLTSRLLELAQADMTRPANETTDVLAVARELSEPALHVAEGVAEAHISKDAARGLLRNLVDNAFLYGATQVWASARAVAGNVELDVRDDGPGISPGNRSRIFDPLFTTAKENGGTGMGLAICRALVNNCHGSIELVPCAKGAAFRITLPAATRGDNPRQRPRRAAAAG